MIYEPFQEQESFHLDCSRFRGVFAGKRSGKTECGAIEAIRLHDGRSNWDESPVDPYVGAIIAPSYRLLKNVSLRKFMSYARPFIKKYNKSDYEITWDDDSLIYGFTDQEPTKMEGYKIYWAWIDEVFDCKEETFLQVLTRLSDTQGRLIITGSLGLSHVVPKHHWVWKYFKEPETRMGDSGVFEWETARNPYFPKAELENAMRTLDIKTFNTLYRINWEATAKAAIFEDLDEGNLRDHEYDEDLETSVSIDWGWQHEMAVGFFQFNRKTGEVFLFDEIVEQKLKREDLWRKIQDKGYKIKNWYCDPAGKQSRAEADGLSMIKWFEQSPRNVQFVHKRSRVAYSISIVRSHIKNSLGQRKFFISPRCRKSWDQMKNYRYAEKSGIITEEPVKEKDDCPDMIRYYFHNRHDIFESEDQMVNLPRWGAFS